MKFPITSTGYPFAKIGHMRGDRMPRIACLVFRWCWKGDTRIRLTFNLTFWRKSAVPFFSVSYRAGSVICARKCSQLGHAV
jgi:hypothetical protein